MEHWWKVIERVTPKFSTASNIDLPGIEHGRPQCEAGDRSSGALQTSKCHWYMHKGLKVHKWLGIWMMDLHLRINYFCTWNITRGRIVRHPNRVTSPSRIKAHHKFTAPAVLHPIMWHHLLFFPHKQLWQMEQQQHSDALCWVSKWKRKWKIHRLVGLFL